MEPSEEVTGVVEQQSSIEIKENSKGEVQISVKVYTYCLPDVLDEASSLAFEQYTKLKQLFDKGVPKKTGK